MFRERGIIEAAVSRHFPSEPRGAFELLRFRFQFDFGQDEPFVCPVENVDFPRVFPDAGQVRYLVDGARLA